MGTARDRSPSSYVTTVVFDVGARYGMHPSWREFGGELRYVAFEPDPDEAQRLRTSGGRGDLEVVEAALDASERERELYLLKHRGLSSFLKPDLGSECFRHLKPGQAEIEKTIRIRTRTIDSIVTELGVEPDFLKVDTEGTEQDVVEGAARAIEASVLGVRSSCNFQPCFIGQRLFSEQHDYLLQRGYTLLNLDYRGFGYPRRGLFRKADPIEPAEFRYGILVAADAVWVRSPAVIADMFGEGLSASIAICKLAYFCLENNAPDVAIDTLCDWFGPQSKPFSTELAETRLFCSLQLRVAEFLGRWRTVPDAEWERCRVMYESIFGEVLEGESRFYPQIQEMRQRLDGIAD